MLNKKNYHKRLNQSREFLLDLQENTNFLVGKRNKRILSSQPKRKILYHQIEENGKLKGGIFQEVDSVGTPEPAVVNQEKNIPFMSASISGFKTDMIRFTELHQTRPALQNIEVMDEGESQGVETISSARKLKNQLPNSTILIQYARNYKRNDSVGVQDTLDQRSKTSIQVAERPKTGGGGRNILADNQGHVIHNQFKHQRKHLASAIQGQRNVQRHMNTLSTNYYNSNTTALDEYTKFESRSRQAIARSRNRNESNASQIHSQFYPIEDKNLTNNQFLKLIKNQSAYRRDNLVKNLSNQMKRTINQTNSSTAMMIMSPSMLSSNMYLNNFDTQSLGINCQIENEDIYQSSLRRNRARPLSTSAICHNNRQAKERCNIQIKKINKTFAKNQHLLQSQNENAKDLKLHHSLEPTKGIPEEFSPKKTISTVSNKILLDQNYKSNLDEGVLKKSLVQIVCTNEEKKEFEIYYSQPIDQHSSKKRMQSAVAYQRNKKEQLTIDGERYPFIDELCQDFVKDAKDFRQNPVTTIKNQESYLGMTLVQFLQENSILPLIFCPEIKKKMHEQVNKFDFYLAKFHQYIISGDYIKALQFIEEGIKFCPQSFIFLFNKGLIYLLQGKNEQAIEIYQRILTKKPNSLSSLQNMLLALLNLSQLDQIIELKKQSHVKGRMMMGKLEKNINQIFIYAEVNIDRNRVQAQNMKSIVTERISITDRDQAYSTIELNNANQSTCNGEVNMNYFRKVNKLNLKERRKVILKKKKHNKSNTECNQSQPKPSLIEKDKKDFEKKRKKFNKMLHQNATVTKDHDSLYYNIKTTIIKEDRSKTPRQQNKSKSGLVFDLSKKRSSSLDEVFKQLNEIQQSYTRQVKDPVEEEYKGFMEDLRQYKLRFGFEEFLASSKRKSVPQKTNTMSSEQMKNLEAAKTVSTAMVRARSFIKNKVNRENSLEAKKRIIQNIESLIDEADNTGTNNKQQKKLVKEVNSIIKDLSLIKQQQNKPQSRGKGTPLPESEQQKEMRRLDTSFIHRLEVIKDMASLEEDQKLMRILGITSQDLQRRKAIENDRMFKVLCPDGITREDKQSFEADTTNFLSFLYDDFMVKSQVVPGTEVPDLFRDSIHMQGIRKYLDLISQTISTKLGIFDDKEDGDKVKWSSPLSHGKIKESKYQALLRKGQDLDTDTQAKSTLAYYFLQKINTMGFLNKIVQDNLEKIKARKQLKKNEFVMGKVGNDLQLQELKFIQTQFKKKKLLRLLDFQLIDNVLSDLKFFSLFDKEVRINLYKMSQYEIYPEAGTILDQNIEKTEYMYVILSGSVQLIKKDHDLEIEIPLSTLKAGESFGDVSIQSTIVNPYDIINKSLIVATNDCETHLLKFQRKEFTDKLFKEMKEDLYQKILLLKNAEFFSDLSPYALLILASNVEVRQFSYGDVIFHQGQIPTECIIVLEGECKSVYDQVVTKSTKVSKFAKKCLQTNLPEPFHYNFIDYKELTQLGKRREKTKEQSEKSSAREKEAKQKLNAVDEHLEEKTHNKFSFQNEILKIESESDKVIFRHHILFDKLKVGSCIGCRALLDKQIVRRNVIEECETYEKQLCITLDQVKKEIEEETKANPHPEINTATDQSMLDLVNKDLNQQSNKSLLEDQNDQSEEEDEEGKAGENVLTDERLQATQSLNNLRSKMYRKMTQQLLTSQVSIIADTSMVKIMAIKREDKNFLNETLKNIIDRKILEIGFRDHDRPRQKMEDILMEAARNKKWTKFKSQLEKAMLREMAMTKKINKLLD